MAVDVLRYKVELVYSSKVKQWLVTNYHQYPSYEFLPVVKQSVLNKLPDNRTSNYYHEIWGNFAKYNQIKEGASNANAISISDYVYSNVDELLAPKQWNVHRDMSPIVAQPQATWFDSPLLNHIPHHMQHTSNWMDEC
jgi:hypothetical protein